MNHDYFRKLISGEKTGLAAIVLRLILWPASLCYFIILQLRNLMYSWAWLKVHHAKAVVISIGNITTGGTGKTPLVIWLCNQLSSYQCAILTRGYKTRKHEPEHLTDEPAIFAESCPEIPVIVNPDRVGGAEEAAIKFGTKVLIMDDGFQHRRLARDLDIITIDATLPFGHNKILPAGLLRESVSSLKRADAVVITRCDQVTENELGSIEKKLGSFNPDIIIAKSIHAPTYIKSMENKEICIETLKDKKIYAFCGIGNPNSFLSTIKAVGAEIVGSKIFNDHHNYTEACISDIIKQAKLTKADLILTTQKDQNKINQKISPKPEIPIAYIAIEIKFLAEEDKLRGLIEKTLASKMPEL